MEPRWRAAVADATAAGWWGANNQTQVRRAIESACAKPPKARSFIVLSSELPDQSRRAGNLGANFERRAAEKIFWLSTRRSTGCVLPIPVVLAL